MAKTLTGKISFNGIFGGYTKELLERDALYPFKDDVKL
jgi:hypothetical protein